MSYSTVWWARSRVRETGRSGVSCVRICLFKKETAYMVSACLMGSEMCLRDSCERGGAERIGTYNFATQFARIARGVARNV